MFLKGETLCKTAKSKPTWLCVCVNFVNDALLKKLVPLPSYQSCANKATHVSP